MKTPGPEPVLRHVANLWTLMEHSWSLDEKLRAMKDAGFDGVCWGGSPELRAGCEKHGLMFVGGMISANAADFPRQLQEQKDCGAVHVNVQLAADEVLTPEALEPVLALNREGKRLGLVPGIETHRGTCTETPEKTYALCDAYQRATGELLPLSMDFSHFAVVKH
ncbi:MAG TPA: xylose isomerase, partial [Candidatus Binatia bacterium]|nr:xylose isomerase [Candidatus Binatia bacterium]